MKKIFFAIIALVLVAVSALAWDGAGWDTGGLAAGGTVGGRLLLPDGTAALPPYTFTTDPDTGMYVSGTELGFSFGGTQRAYLNANGLSATRINVDDIRDISGVIIFKPNGLTTMSLGGTNGYVRAYLRYIDTVQSETCTAGAGVAALTITPTTSYVEITNSDADGCNITLGESTTVSVGQTLTLCVISNAGTTVNFADTAGVTELAGAFAADIDDCITLRYGNTTTWREVSRSAN